MTSCRWKKAPSWNKKGGLAVFLAVFLLSWVPGGAVATASHRPSLAVRSAIAIDAETGQILYQKKANEALPIASTTKLLAAYVVLNQIEQGKLDWQTPVKVDQATARLSRRPALTNVSLTAGQTYTVRDLYRATLIYSANAAITAIGTKIAGSPQRFVALMQKTAKQLGLNSAHLVTASGITNGQAGSLGDRSLKRNVENTMSARDLAKLAKILVKDYPEVLKTTRKRLAWFDKRGSNPMVMTNWNQLLPGAPLATPNLLVDGLKTGTSKAAGANFVGTVKKDGRRIITVVMHARNVGSSDPARFVATKQLLNWVYKTYQPVTLKAGDDVSGAEQVPAFYGKDKTSKLRLARDTTVWLLKKQSPKEIRATLKLAADKREKSGLKTPVKKAESVGSVQLKVAGHPIEQVAEKSPLQAPVKTIAKNDRVNWFVAGWRNFTSWFG